ncbi:hypothetical protein V8C42DRAFT_294575 [Trichoderma barbatum]
MAYEEDYWAGTFDWTRLRQLWTSSVWLPRKFQPYLTALKEVDLLGSADSMETRAFYAQIPSRLERISAPTLDSIGIDSVLRHGSHLRALQLHRKEDGSDIWREKTVDAESLRAIRDQCQSLEELHIDLATDGEWPYELFDIIVSFPRLKTLSLWFELGRYSDSSPIQLYVTFSSCDTIFRCLWDHLVSRPPHLQELRGFSGSPRYVGFGYPSPEAFWSTYNSWTFLCSLSERRRSGRGNSRYDVSTSQCHREQGFCNSRRSMARIRKSTCTGNPGRTGQVVSKIGSFLSGGRFSLESSQNKRPGHWVDQVSRECMQVAWKGPVLKNSWEPHY